MPLNIHDTIIAIATPQGEGAIGVIRLSGSNAIKMVNKVFSKDLELAQGYSVHFGKISVTEEGLTSQSLKDVAGDEPQSTTLDEVLLTVFRAPKSYTKEDVVEISFHGSPFILSEALNLFINAGARLAKPGEFTQRAFLNGALDLAQAEAVADLIASESAAAHSLAMGQLKGGVSNEISKLRSELLDFVSLIELELDFGEEDVEFADREKLLQLIQKIMGIAARLADSFKLGNALKNGIVTVIAGRPNAGKSTLLNALLGEDRAIVSDLPGTTRDTIEETLVIEGVMFRLIDTAGIREAQDKIEAIGVQRTMEKIGQAAILLYLYDAVGLSQEEVAKDLAQFKREDMEVIAVANKEDLVHRLHDSQIPDWFAQLPAGHLIVSAESGSRLEELKQRLYQAGVGQGKKTEKVIISNVRHYQALKLAGEALASAEFAIREGLSGELIALDIRLAIHRLGEITGEITTDEVLGHIFGKFCIGK